MNLLKEVSDKVKLPSSEIIRRMLDAFLPLHNSILSGAMILGIKAVTTSGEVWIGKGF